MTVFPYMFTVGSLVPVILFDFVYILTYVAIFGGLWAHIMLVSGYIQKPLHDVHIKNVIKEMVLVIQLDQLLASKISLIMPSN